MKIKDIAEIVCTELPQCGVVVGKRRSYLAATDGERPYCEEWTLSIHWPEAPRLCDLLRADSGPALLVAYREWFQREAGLHQLPAWQPNAADCLTGKE